MWKPNCVLPDGSEVTLPDSIQTDEQAAFFYGGLAFAVLQDLHGDRLTSDERERAVALGLEISGQYQQESMGMAFTIAGIDHLIGDDGPVISPNDSAHVRHRKVHSARRAA